MQGAIFGKHPGYGDFLSAGLSPAAVALLEGWCEDWVAGLKAHFGPLWPQVWQAAPSLRLWLGEAVAGQVICGVMTPSQDRVGRRYPLFVLLTGADPLALPDPPVLAADQAAYDGLEAAGSALSPSGGAQAMAAALPLPDVAAALSGPAAFWAERVVEAAPAAPAHLQLLRDVALTDHRRAAAGRCYFWTLATAEAPARFHAGPGLPEAAVMHWLITLPQPEGAPGG